MIATISVVTILLRALPFLAMEKLSQNRYLSYLGQQMPTGVMVLLVAYTLKDDDFTAYPFGLPKFAAMAIAIVLYWKTRNSLLSIGMALTAYMLTINVII